MQVGAAIANLIGHALIRALRSGDGLGIVIRIAGELVRARQLNSPFGQLLKERFLTG
jgi:hypothetical protein